MYSLRYLPDKYIDYGVYAPDDLSSILKVLSLERYQPIFEEQEVRCKFDSSHY